MNLTIGVTPALQSLLQGISDKLTTIITNQQKEQQSMSKLDDQIATLTAQVAKNTDVEASATLVIQGIATQLAKAVADATAAGATPAQLSSLTALGTSLSTSGVPLAAAIAANTTPPPPGP